MNFEKCFGTDGIRGRVGKFPITPEFFLKFGVIIGQLLFKSSCKKVVVGIDTRISSYMLESALNSGFSSAGVVVISVGIIPTPAIGYLIKLLKLEVGIMISASHNLFRDNGIKLFLKDGIKASVILEKKLEKEFKKPISYLNMVHVASKEIIYCAHDAKYIKFCKSTLSKNFSLKRFKIVLDCANGSTYKVAPRIFRDLKANLIVIFASPNGYNINKRCGSTDISNLKKMVLFEQADIGLAFDGDGDRVIMVDHLGNKVDGDQILYILAKFNLCHKASKKEGVVGTVMSNNGLLIALKELNVPFVKVDVGDKNIIKKLKEKKWRFGAESSGHVIILNKSSVCDGIITSLQVIEIMIKTNMNLYQLCSGIILLPQKIVNICFDKANSSIKYKKIKVEISKYKNMLGRFGRMFIRRSGTELCFRIMIEDRNYSIVQFIFSKLTMIFNCKSSVLE
ncbi:MAG: phosphoglucosamine mutase [Buchnera aphidicola (Meitanaphis microgallis)]